LATESLVTAISGIFTRKATGLAWFVLRCHMPSTSALLRPMLCD
jgi:hypothetical protein